MLTKEAIVSEFEARCELETTSSSERLAEAKSLVCVRDKSNGLPIDIDPQKSGSRKGTA